MIDFTPLVEEISKGVKVVALSRGFLRSASIAVLIGRGSYEDPTEGCACLANRMRLRLTSKLDPLRLQIVMDRLGATVDATADRDHTLLRAQVPSKKVDEGLRFLAGLYMSPSFRPMEVTREKTSQKLEYEKVRQNPITASVADAWEATFPENPLGHPATGHPETIEKLTPSMLEIFDKQTRKKAPLILAIVGPQPERVLVDYAEASFGCVKIVPHVEKLAPSSRHRFNVLRRSLEVKQTTFAVGMVAPGVSSSDYPGLLLLEDHLGSDRHYTGVLFRELREKRGLTYFASTSLSPLRDCGLLIAYAGVKHEKVTEALGLMLEYIVKMRNKPIRDKTIAELKAFHRQVIEVMHDVPSQAATWLAANAFRGGKIDREAYVREMEAVTPDEIRRIAAKLLQPSRIALSVAGNPPDEETLKSIMERKVG